MNLILDINFVNKSYSYIAHKSLENLLIRSLITPKISNYSSSLNSPSFIIIFFEKKIKFIKKKNKLYLNQKYQKNHQCSLI